VAAQAKRDKREVRNALERLRDLLARSAPDRDVHTEGVRLMRYQLLSALAGTEIEAAAAGADYAVLMIHDSSQITGRRRQPISTWPISAASARRYSTVSRQAA
jgi:hypothetical protein